MWSRNRLGCGDSIDAVRAYYDAAVLLAARLDLLTALELDHHGADRLAVQIKSYAALIFLDLLGVFKSGASRSWAPAQSGAMTE